MQAMKKNSNKFDGSAEGLEKLTSFLPGWTFL